MHKVELQNNKKAERTSKKLGMHVFGESRETCSYLKYRKRDPLSHLIKYSSCGGMGRGGGGGGGHQG